MPSNFAAAAGFALLAAATACTERPPEPEPAAQGVVDSIFPVEEEVRRFKAQLPGTAPTALAGGAASREDLARRLIRAIETRDSMVIRSLVLTPWEFIELYYPHTKYTKPPYKQSPQLLWFFIQQNSEKGIGRALDRFGGRPAGYQRVECLRPAVLEERNRLHEACVVRWSTAQGKPDPFKLFGTILERDGRFKFISYANDL